MKRYRVIFRWSSGLTMIETMEAPNKEIMQQAVRNILGRVGERTRGVMYEIKEAND